jgi:hypothetical protein
LSVRRRDGAQGRRSPEYEGSEFALVQFHLEPRTLRHYASEMIIPLRSIEKLKPT